MIEDRLREWGSAEAMSAGEPPVFTIRAAKRPWWPALAAAAAAASIAVATGVVVGSHHPAPKPAGPVSHVVPWADLPPAPYSPPPTLPPLTADPTVPACSAADLTAAVGNGEGATGNWFTSFSLTNVSSSPCRLTGQLDGLSGVHAGVRTSIRVTHGSSVAGSTVPVVLRPGAAGVVYVDYYRRCDTSPTRTSTYVHLRLAMLGGTVAVTSGSLDLGCDAASVGINATPLGGPAPETTYAPDPRTSLTVSLDVPSTVQAGDVLRYVVTLANPTASPIRLDPCPNFLQVIGLDKDPHLLNCAAAGPVPAQGREQFAMELRVPADTPSGARTVTWALEVGTATPTTADITVTGGSTGPTAQTCKGGDNGVPCGPGMVVGQPYPYALYTHCGVTDLYADGRWWHALPGQPSDASGRMNFTAGTVTLQKPNVRLTWRGSEGPTYAFGPAESPVLCS